MKTVALVGFGASNRALCEHFLSLGIQPCVHLESQCALPNGVSGAFGKDYLTCYEDTVFRSPVIKPTRIKTRGKILCESEYALSKISAKQICITGSDGKTTTSTLIYEMLRREHSAFLGGNIGTPLIYALQGQYDFAVCELSSFQLYDFEPRCEAAIITNITENHLDWHSDMNEYRLSKENILKRAKRRILCYDDPYLHALGKKYENITYFSLSDISCLRGNKAYIKNGFVCYNGAELLRVSDTRLKGSFNLLNILAAICACAPYVSTDTIAQVAREFKGVASRLEHIKTVDGVSFVNSSIDTTPSRTLSTLSAFDKAKTILLLGGADKNLSFEPFDGALDDLKSAVVFGAARDKIIPHLKCRHITVNTLNEAVHCARSLACKGDTVLLSPACTSFDMYKSYKERAQDFINAVKKISS